MISSRTVALSLLVTGALTTTAQAEWAIDGFGTLGVARVIGDASRYGTNDEYTDEWRSEPVSRAALQGRYQWSEQLGLTGQLLVTGEMREYELDAEWLYMDYQLTDSFEVRAGHLRLPIFFLSESLDVGYSYPWIRPPVEVYGQVPLSSYTGGDLRYHFVLAEHDVTLQVSAGQVDGNSYYQQLKTRLKARDIWSSSLTVNYDHGRVRLGHIAATLGVENQLGAAQGLSSSFSSLGYYWEREGWLSYGEVASRRVEGALLADTHSAYLMLGYQLQDWLPHLTWGWEKTVDHARIAGVNVKGARQTSWTLGVRYDMRPGLAFKAEYSLVDTHGPEGYSGFFAHNGRPTNMSADVASLAVDFVF